MIRTLLILTFIISFNAFATDSTCSFKLPSQIVFPNSFSFDQVKQVIKSENCNKKLTDRLIKTLSNYNGLINTNYLSQIIDSRGVTKITPKTINIIKLSNLITERFYPHKNAFVTSLKLFSNQMILGISNSQALNLECANCDSFGEKNIGISLIDKHNGDKKQYWISATIKTTVKALTATSHLPTSMEPLELKDFVSRPVQTTNPTQFFTHIDQISHYRLNKPLIKGSPLKRSDLTPIFLVSPGTIAELVFKNDTIKLSGRAYPKQRGRFGETIKLGHPKTGKEIYGKVVGKNKVVVEI